MVQAYLQMCPADEAVAQGWIEAVAQRSAHLPEAHELAALIGETLSGNEKIQQSLAELYLSQRRCDFEALQTYRRVWWSSAGLPPELIPALSGLLVSEGFINDWALAVYLEGHAAGDKACIEGLAAGICRLKTNTANRSDLDAAREALAHMDADRIGALAERFQPVEAASPEAPPSPSAALSFTAVGEMLQRVGGVVRRSAASGRLQIGRLMARAAKAPAKTRWWGAAAVVAVVAAVALMGPWSSEPESLQGCPRPWRRSNPGSRWCAIRSPFRWRLT